MYVAIDVLGFILFRVSLDYLAKQRKKGESPGKTLEFRRPGEEELIEEEKRRQKLIESTSVFGLMNRSEMTHTLSELIQKQEEVNIIL